ncbi:MAG: Pycsar system effector family protein [Limnothrix sp.]
MPQKFLGAPHSFAEPDKAYRIQLLRLTLQNHLRLSDTADNKANIIIGISTVVFSLLLPQIQERGFIPHLTTLLMTAALSGLTGILSVTPRIYGVFTFFANSSEKKENKQSFNPLFFSAFIHMPEEEYVDYIFEHVLQTESDIYQAILVDLHRLGKVLDQKYRYLGYSYSIFASGLLISGILLFIHIVNDV